MTEDRADPSAGTHQCVRCGEEFESETERTMHVIRQRCPEIESEEDVNSVDTMHALESLLGSVGGDTDESD